MLNASLKLSSMKFLFFLLVLVSICFSESHGQPIDAHGPNEVYYGIDIIEGKNNRLFLSTSGGLYLSDNLGDQWHRVDASLNSIYFEPRFTINSYNDVLYAWDRKNGIYSTSDNGENWKFEIIILPNGQAELTALGVHSDDIFIGTKTGLFYAHGSDFLKFATSVPALESKEITTIHVEGETVIAGTKQDGVYLSEDLGITWENISTDLPAGFNVTGITVWQQTIFVYSELGGLYYTNDKGDNWLAKTTGLSGLGHVIKLVVDGDKLYAATGGYDKVYHSDLGNGSWTLIDNGIPDVGITTSLYVSGDNLIVLSWHGIYKSVNGGASFVPSYNGVADAFEFTDMQVTADGTIWAVASHTGLYKKQLGQELFTPVERIIGGSCGSGLLTGDIFPFVQENKVRIYNSSTNLWEDEIPIDNILFPTRFIRWGSEVFLSSKIGGIFRYTGTATWETFNDGLVSLAVTDFINLGEDLLVGTEDGLFSRAVSDAEWNRISFSETEMGIRKLFVKDNMILLTAADYNTYRSDDGGVTWDIVTEMSGYDVEAYTSAGDILYAGSFGKLFISSDGGKSWASRTLPNVFVTSMVAADGKLWMGAIDLGILSTSLKIDQEITFSTFPENSETPGVHAYGEDPIELTANSTSNLAVTFTSSNEQVAHIEQDKVVITGVGQTTITASQSGNDLYLPAIPKDQTLVVEKGNQSITFDALTAKTYGDESLTPIVKSSSALDVTLTSSNPSIAEIAAGKIFIRKAGVVEITASQPGNALYNAAISVTHELTIAKASQTILFETVQEKTMGDAPFELQAIASSTLPVSFHAADASIVTIAGNWISIQGPGTVTITAIQEGNENYEAAPSVSRELVINNILGIEERLPFSLYPNPTTSILTFDTSEDIKHITVVNDKGQPCDVSWIHNQVDLSPLNAGCYYLQISVGDLIYNTKIIKL